MSSRVAYVLRDGIRLCRVANYAEFSNGAICIQPSTFAGTSLRNHDKDEWSVTTGSPAEHEYEFVS
eukprot:COSAG02_NODE_92_length_37588_cov_135.916242_32_plen_66_part_00